ncbi:MAG: electron-transferring-flavoprotein dehydrogenase [Saprospiraceae bacterium]|jgi:electron-transferring-flavoprotein dehydrogenase
MTRESMPFDVVIVGAGPAGLSAAIRLAQLNQETGREQSICVVEKAAEVGAHSLAGAVIEPRSLNELLPNWKEMGAPLKSEVKKDALVYLTKTKAIKLPTPPQMHNEGNYVASLGLLTRWLGEQAEALGVDIFPGFAAAEILYDDNGRIMGIATGVTGVNKDGTESGSFDPGMELHAKVTLFAEGCRGSLSRQLMEKFNLRDGKQPQSYALGIKEIWEVPDEQHSEGDVFHSIGWPLKADTYGGGFAYHMDKNQIAVGFAVGLDYTNPHLSPFEEFQRFKTHPAIRKQLEGGKRVSYGARAISEGGFQSIPHLHVGGGLLIGDAAGFLNTPKIKGTHTAMKSGMVAAESAFKFLNGESEADLEGYAKAIEDSWLHNELKSVRNIRPGFNKGFLFGMANAALVAYITKGKEPWTMGYHEDHTTLKPAKDCTPIDYPKPDGKLTFDRLSSVYLSNTNHEENQPAHLTLKDPAVAIDTNLALYNSPESRYCPAGVYEIVKENDKDVLQINAQNCVHCKTCDIKDPTQNIVWIPPEGGGGPLYSNM